MIEIKILLDLIQDKAHQWAESGKYKYDAKHVEQLLRECAEFMGCNLADVYEKV